MKKSCYCIIICFLLSLVLLTSCTSPAYYVRHGIDFANGIPVETISLTNGGRRIWTRYQKNDDSPKVQYDEDGDPIFDDDDDDDDEEDDDEDGHFGTSYEQLYAKYKIGHNKPLIDVGLPTGYRTRYFIHVKRGKQGLKFWRWKWSFSKRKPFVFFDGSGPSSEDFLEYLQEYEPPVEEAQEMYSELVKRFHDKKAFRKYINKKIHKPILEKKITAVQEIIDSGSLAAHPETSKQDVIYIIRSFRNRLPDQLPDKFMKLVLAEDMEKMDNFDDGKSNTVLLFEYLRQPSPRNALYLILGQTQKVNISHKRGPDGLLTEPNYLNLSNLFSRLTRAGKLETFLSQLSVDDVQTPPLPPPAPIEEPTPQFFNEKTYQNLPFQEKLLKISCYPQLYQQHWQDMLGKLSPHP